VQHAALQTLADRLGTGGTGSVCHVLESSKLLLTFFRHLRTLLNAVTLLLVFEAFNGADLLFLGH
jgi:hypothetical protein